MRKLIKIILLLIVVAGIMFFTCPEEERHIDKLTNEIIETAQKGQNNGEDNDLLENLGNAIVETISEKVVHIYVKSQLKVDNYQIINVGKMYYDGEKRVVTIGAFNHVFCLVKAYDLLDEIKTH